MQGPGAPPLGGGSTAIHRRWQQFLPHERQLSATAYLASTAPPPERPAVTSVMARRSQSAIAMTATPTTLTSQQIMTSSSTAAINSGSSMMRYPTDTQHLVAAANTSTASSSAARQLTATHITGNGGGGSGSSAATECAPPQHHRVSTNTLPPPPDEPPPPPGGRPLAAAGGMGLLSAQPPAGSSVSTTAVKEDVSASSNAECGVLTLQEGMSRQASLNILRQVDATVRRIVVQLSFASVYILDEEAKMWARAHVEGILFIVRRQRSASSRYGLMVLNPGNCGSHLVEDVTAMWEVLSEAHYIFVRIPVDPIRRPKPSRPEDRRVCALWFCNDYERRKILESLGCMLRELVAELCCRGGVCPLRRPMLTDVTGRTSPPSTSQKAVAPAGGTGECSAAADVGESPAASAIVTDGGERKVAKNCDNHDDGGETDLTEKQAAEREELREVDREDVGSRGVEAAQCGSELFSADSHGAGELNIHSQEVDNDDNDNNNNNDDDDSGQQQQRQREKHVSGEGTAAGENVVNGSLGGARSSNINDDGGSSHRNVRDERRYSGTVHAISNTMQSKYGGAADVMVRQEREPPKTEGRGAIRGWKIERRETDDTDGDIVCKDGARLLNWDNEVNEGENDVVRCRAADFPRNDAGDDGDLGSSNGTDDVDADAYFSSCFANAGGSDRETSVYRHMYRVENSSILEEEKDDRTCWVEPALTLPTKQGASRDGRRPSKAPEDFERTRLGLQHAVTSELCTGGDAKHLPDERERERCAVDVEANGRIPSVHSKTVQRVNKDNDEKRSENGQSLHHNVQNDEERLFGESSFVSKPSVFSGQIKGTPDAAEIPVRYKMLDDDNCTRGRQWSSEAISRLTKDLAGAMDLKMATWEGRKGLIQTGHQPWFGDVTIGPAKTENGKSRSTLREQIVLELARRAAGGDMECFSLINQPLPQSNGKIETELARLLKSREAVDSRASQEQQSASRRESNSAGQKILELLGVCRPLTAVEMSASSAPPPTIPSTASSAPPPTIPSTASSAPPPTIPPTASSAPPPTIPSTVNHLPPHSQWYLEVPHPAAGGTTQQNTAQVNGKASHHLDADDVKDDGGLKPQAALVSSSSMMMKTPPQHAEEIDEFKSPSMSAVVDGHDEVDDRYFPRNNLQRSLLEFLQEQQQILMQSPANTRLPADQHPQHQLYQPSVPSRASAAPSIDVLGYAHPVMQQLVQRVAAAAGRSSANPAARPRTAEVLSTPSHASQLHQQPCHSNRPQNGPSNGDSNTGRSHPNAHAPPVRAGDFPGLHQFGPGDAARFSSPSPAARRPAELTSDRSDLSDTPTTRERRQGSAYPHNIQPGAVPSTEPHSLNAAHQQLPQRLSGQNALLHQPQNHDPMEPFSTPHVSLPPSNPFPALARPLNQQPQNQRPQGRIAQSHSPFATINGIRLENSEPPQLPSLSTPHPPTASISVSCTAPSAVAKSPHGTGSGCPRLPPQPPLPHGGGRQMVTSVGSSIVPDHHTIGGQPAASTVRSPIPDASRRSGNVSARLDQQKPDSNDGIRKHPPLSLREQAEIRRKLSALSPADRHFLRTEYGMPPELLGERDGDIREDGCLFRTLQERWREFADNIIAKRYDRIATAMACANSMTTEGDAEAQMLRLANNHTSNVDYVNKINNTRISSNDINSNISRNNCAKGDSASSNSNRVFQHPSSRPTFSLSRVDHPPTDLPLLNQTRLRDTAIRNTNPADPSHHPPSHRLPAYRGNGGATTGITSSTKSQSIASQDASRLAATAIAALQNFHAHHHHGGMTSSAGEQNPSAAVRQRQGAAGGAGQLPQSSLTNGPSAPMLLYPSPSMDIHGHYRADCRVRSSVAEVDNVRNGKRPAEQQRNIAASNAMMEANAKPVAAIRLLHPSAALSSSSSPFNCGARVSSPAVNGLNLPSHTPSSRSNPEKKNLASPAPNTATLPTTSFSDSHHFSRRYPSIGGPHTQHYPPPSQSPPRACTQFTARSTQSSSLGEIPPPRSPPGELITGRSCGGLIDSTVASAPSTVASVVSVATPRHHDQCATDRAKYALSGISTAGGTDTLTTAAAMTQKNRIKLSGCHLGTTASFNSRQTFPLAVQQPHGPNCNPTSSGDINVTELPLPSPSSDIILKQPMRIHPAHTSTASFASGAMLSGSRGEIAPRGTRSTVEENSSATTSSGAPLAHQQDKLAVCTSELPLVRESNNDVAMGSLRDKRDAQREPTTLIVNHSTPSGDTMGLQQLKQKSNGVLQFPVDGSGTSTLDTAQQQPGSCTVDGSGRRMATTRQSTGTTGHMVEGSYKCRIAEFLKIAKRKGCTLPAAAAALLLLTNGGGCWTRSTPVVTGDGRGGIENPSRIVDNHNDKRGGGHGNVLNFVRGGRGAQEEESRTELSMGDDQRTVRQTATSGSHQSSPLPFTSPASSPSAASAQSQQQHLGTSPSVITGTIQLPSQTSRSIQSPQPAILQPNSATQSSPSVSNKGANEETQTMGTAYVSSSSYQRPARGMDALKAVSLGSAGGIEGDNTTRQRDVRDSSTAPRPPPSLVSSTRILTNSATPVAHSSPLLQHLPLMTCRSTTVSGSDRSGNLQVGSELLPSPGDATNSTETTTTTPSMIEKKQPEKSRKESEQGVEQPLEISSILKTMQSEIILRQLQHKRDRLIARRDDDEGNHNEKHVKDDDGEIDNLARQSVNSSPHDHSAPFTTKPSSIPPTPTAPRTAQTGFNIINVDNNSVSDSLVQVVGSPSGNQVSINQVQSSSTSTSPPSLHPPDVVEPKRTKFFDGPSASILSQTVHASMSIDTTRRKSSPSFMKRPPPPQIFPSYPGVVSPRPTSLYPLTADALPNSSAWSPSQVRPAQLSRPRAISTSSSTATRCCPPATPAEQQPNFRARSQLSGPAPPEPSHDTGDCPRRLHHAGRDGDPRRRPAGKVDAASLNVIAQNDAERQLDRRRNLALQAVRRWQGIAATLKCVPRKQRAESSGAVLGGPTADPTSDMCVLISRTALLGVAKRFFCSDELAVLLWDKVLAAAVRETGIHILRGVARQAAASAAAACVEATLDPLAARRDVRESGSSGATAEMAATTMTSTTLTPTASKCNKLPMRYESERRSSKSEAGCQS